MNLLFVCTGNTCRSPLAEVITRAEARRRRLSDVRPRSAGISAYPGHPASTPAVTVADAHGLDLSRHRSRLLDRDLIEWADVILAMTRWHADAIRAAVPGARVELLGRYLPEGHEAWGRDVPDPVGGDLATYERTFEVLAAAVAGLFDAFGDDTPAAGGAAG